ncbi:hypothetical protein OPQ81_000611 [Rhizoctonia solani]|nr:hypothetical protein OPQ81_000611 [Rhizoctonia solani]
MPPRRLIQDLNTANGPPTSKTAYQLATEVSPQESRKISAVSRRLQASLDAVLNRVGGTKEDFFKSVQEEASSQLDHSNPHTRRNHENAKVWWASLLIMSRPNIPAEEYWARETVKDFACEYLVTRFRLTKGRDGGKVKAITVASWAGHLIFCIAYFTYDPQTNLKCGQRLLTGTGNGEPGLYMLLIQTVKDLTVRHNLDRLPSARYTTLGKRDLQLAIEYAMSQSLLHGRGPRLQMICAMLMHFGSGARPSSLAAIHKDMAERGQYMCLGDLKFYRAAPGRYDVHITYRHFKGYYTAVIGTQAMHIYKGLTKVHNLPFDPFWFIAYYFIRDAFEYDDITALINSTDHELRVKKSKEKEPLFIKVKPGGEYFVEPIEPTIADNLSQQVSGILQNGVGIKSTSYGFRRGAATEFEVTAGKNYSSILLHHRDALTLNDRHYSMGTATLDLLGLRLGEVNEPLQPGVEERLALTARIGAAVVLVAGDLATHSNDESEDEGEGEERVAKSLKSGATARQNAFENKRTEQVHDLLDESEQVKRYKEIIKEQWPIFLEPFGPGSAMYKKLSAFRRGKGNVTSISTKPEYGYEDAIKKTSPEVAEASKRAMQLLHGSYQGISDLKKQLTKVVTRRIRREENFEDLANPSTKHVDDAMAHFEKPSHLLSDAVKFDTGSKRATIELSKTLTPGAGPSTSTGPSAMAGQSTTTRSEVTTGTLFDGSAIATLASEEDEADDEAVRDGVRDILSHPIISLCGAGQDEENVLKSYLGMEQPLRTGANPATSTGNTPNNTEDQEDDPESPFQSGLSPMQDQNEEVSEEVSALKDMDTARVREMLLRFAIAPVIAERAFKKQVELMKEVDDIQRAKRSEKEAARAMRLPQRELLLNQSAQVLMSMDENNVIHHARHFECPEEDIRPDVVKRVVELAHIIGTDWLGEN